jgi:putative FmdB family regulatory protein
VPIYEYYCSTCNETFERLELSIIEIPTSQCPKCKGVGSKVISSPAIVYDLFDPTAVHKLPDWHTQNEKAKVHDAKVKRQLRNLPPLQYDRGAGTKVYETEFGTSERRKLESKAQLDNMP